MSLLLGDLSFVSTSSSLFLGDSLEVDEIFSISSLVWELSSIFFLFLFVLEYVFNFFENLFSDSLKSWSAFDDSDSFFSFFKDFFSSSDSESNEFEFFLFLFLNLDLDSLKFFVDSEFFFKDYNKYYTIS